MFSCYLNLERRQSTKKDGTESKTPRYAVTAQAGYFKPLEVLKDTKGNIVMYLNGTLGIIESPDTRRADCYLQCKDSMNFSSVYTLELNSKSIIAHGTPPDKQMLKPKTVKKQGKVTQVERANPFYENRNDGYLFLIAPDYKTIEILIVPNGRYLIQGLAKKLADGQCDEAIKTMRVVAKQVFQ
jgi:hypothetical protein